MINAVYALLNADTELLSHLPGQLWNALDVQEISRQNTPAAFNVDKEIQACALLKEESATPWGPNYNSGRIYFVLYLYQRFGYQQIDQARKRIYTILHRQQVIPLDGSGLYQIDHAGDVLGMEDQALTAAMQLSRFVATVQRR